MSRRVLGLLVAITAGLALATAAFAAPSQVSGVTMESRTSTSVTVVATIQSDSPVQFVFQYGGTDSYGQQTPETAATTQGGNTYTATYTIGGLAPNATYHVRALAKNADGDGFAAGPDSTVTTAGLPPQANGGVSQDGQTATTITARTNVSSSSPVTFPFKYGKTIAYGSETTETSATSQDGTNYTATQTISGLESNTQYHVRVVATNQWGTTEGSDSIVMTAQGDADGDGVPDHIDPCPNTPGNGGAGCPQPDGDGDGVPNQNDRCPATPGTGGNAPGCPPGGTPTIRTNPVRALDEDAAGFLFSATGNARGQGALVSFQVSITPDFTPRGDVDGPSQANCVRRNYADDLDVGNDTFALGGEVPNDGWYRDATVECVPNHPRSDKRIFTAWKIDGYGKYTNRYVRAVATYDAGGAKRQVFGDVQTFNPSGGGAGGGGGGKGRGATTRSLKKALAVAGRRARIRALLKAGSFTAAFAAPSAGKAEIVWRYTPKAKSSAKRKPVVVARGSKSAARPGKVKVKVKLTKKGRALLKRSKKIKLVAQGSFKPRGGAKVTSKRSISLKR